MVAQLLVQGVELLARGRAHYAGDAEIAALAAGTHLDTRRIEVRSMLAHDIRDCLRESGLLASHDLDREIARERERRAIGEHSHQHTPFRRKRTPGDLRASPCA